MEKTQIAEVEQKSRRVKATARIEPHRCSQRASGHFRDNDFSKAFMQPKKYRTSFRFRDTETIDQGLNQDGHHHWAPNPEALYF